MNDQVRDPLDSHRGRPIPGQGYGVLADRPALFGRPDDHLEGREWAVVDVLVPGRDGYSVVVREQGIEAGVAA
jgi:hypothetical protein